MGAITHPGCVLACGGRPRWHGPWPPEAIAYCCAAGLLAKVAQQEVAGPVHVQDRCALSCRLAFRRWRSATWQVAYGMMGKVQGGAL